MLVDIYRRIEKGLVDIHKVSWLKNADIYIPPKPKHALALCMEPAPLFVLHHSQPRQINTL